MRLSSEDVEFIGRRFLEDTGDNLTYINEADPQSSNILLSSLRVYGSIFAVGFPLYCIIRKLLPRIYAVRQWVPDIKTHLAENQFGHISWIWKVYSFSSLDLEQTISLDAICFLRLMNMGFRLACIGVLNSLWLVPIYITAPKDPNVQQTDDVEKIAISHLIAGSHRFVATVLAAYLFYAYTFYTILKEFRWFISKRHEWLKKFNARNYTILVRNIPKELRSDTLLGDHFKMVYGPDKVLKAHVCLHFTRLRGLISKRERCVANLEHALAVLAIRGKRPRHCQKTKTSNSTMPTVSNTVMSSVGPTGDGRRTWVDSIDCYTEELGRLNTNINTQINMIEVKQRPKMHEREGTTFRRYLTVKSASLDEEDMATSFRQRKTTLTGGLSNGASDESQVRSRDETPSGEANENDEESEFDDSNSSKRTKLKATASLVKEKAKNAGSFVKRKAVKNARKRVNQAKHTVVAAKGFAGTMLRKNEDGLADDAGFVTFKSLTAMYGALQMSQHHEPFVLDVHAAPGEPHHIFWHNVGKDKEAIQTGTLISFVTTGALCLFWTFIVTTIVNLTNVDKLKKNYPVLEQTLDSKPWVAPTLGFISPVLLLIFNTGLLPIILKAISRLEFPASASLLEASAFWKMAAFQIIQTFFVSLLSGKFTTQLIKILERPSLIVTLLGQALPEQSAYFMQLLMVSTCVGTLTELFRVIPLLQAAGRCLLGRNLTEKERGRSFGPLKPVSLVDKFYFSRVQARFLLYFMVMFVYSTINPLVPWFTMVFFLLLGSVYRHQFVFNYPKTPDSGGEIWLYFMKVLLGCILIAQVTLLGFLVLKKSAIGAPMMIPLLVISALFIVYLKQRHFQIGEYLPARSCLRQDLENEEDGLVYDSFLYSYKSPALMSRSIEVDWDAGKSDARKAREVKADEEESRSKTITIKEHTTEKQFNENITGGNSLVHSLDQYDADTLRMSNAELNELANVLDTIETAGTTGPSKTETDTFFACCVESIK